MTRFMKAAIAVIMCAGTGEAFALAIATAKVNDVDEFDGSSSAVVASAFATSLDGVASASANLHSASVRAFARGAGIGGTFAATAQATARFSDTLTILGDINGTLSGTASFHVSGNLVPASNETASFVSVGANSSFLVGSIFSQVNVFSYTAQSQGCGPTATNFLCENTLNVQKTIELPFTVTDAHRSLIIEMTMVATATQDGVADFSNTGFVTLNLPQGNTFSSASGVFLTTPIPEPSTYSMLALGLLCCCAMTGVRRTS